MIKIAFIFLLITLPAAAQNVTPLLDYWMDWEAEPKILNYNEIVRSIPFRDWMEEMAGITVFYVQFDSIENYIQHKVEKEVHPQMTAYVAPYLPELRISPAMCNGLPHTCWMVVFIRFEIIRE